MSANSLITADELVSVQVRPRASVHAVPLAYSAESIRQESVPPVGLRAVRNSTQPTPPFAAPSNPGVPPTTTGVVTVLTATGSPHQLSEPALVHVVPSAE